MEKKKVSQKVPIQSFISRPLYAELVRICALDDITIKQVVESLIEDYVKHDKILTRQWAMSEEEYKKCLTAYETYLNIRDKIESLQKGEKTK